MNPTLEEIADLAPWLRHLMVALIERQLFEDEFRLIMKTQLPADAPSEGAVPGRPDWTYQKGWSCWFLANQEMRLSMEISTKESASTFNLLLILGSLSRWSGPDPGPEVPAFGQAFKRCAEWLPGPSAAAWHAVDELLELGVIVSTSADAYQLASSLLDELESLGPRATAAPFPEVVEEPDPSHSSWRAWLRRIAGDAAHSALSELHEELDDEEVERIVWKFLQQPPGPGTAAALDVAAQRELDIPDAAVASLILQIDPLAHDEFAVTILAVANYALPRNIARDAIVSALVEYARGAVERRVDYAEGLDEDLREMLRHEDTTFGGTHGLAEIAALLLEYAPERAIDATRRALREDPTMQLVLAGRLVAIGQPWAIREVVAASEDIVDPGIRMLFVESLRSRGFEDAAQKATAAQTSTLSEFGFMADMLAETLAVATGVMNDESVMEAHAEWADRIRAGLPDGFDPE